MEKHEDCSELDVEGKGPGQIALVRCDCLIKQYLRWKKENHRWSNIARSATLILTTIIPVVVLTGEGNNVKIVAALLAAGAAISTGLMTIAGWRDNYERYGEIWHRLQGAKCRYLVDRAAANDQCSDQQHKLDTDFADRIEKLVDAEVTNWHTAVHAVKDSDLIPRTG